MVKNVSLVIGCVILSLSVALIVPTSCSPIVENEQEKINLIESRSKRSTSTNLALANSAASSEASSSSLLPILLPYLLSSHPSFKAIGGGITNPNFGNGLAGIIGNLNPLLQWILGPLVTALSQTVGGLGSSLDSGLGKIDEAVPALDPLTGGLGNILSSLLGSAGGGARGSAGGGSVTQPSSWSPPSSNFKQINPIALLSLLSKSSSSSTSAASSTSSTTVTASKP